MMFIIELIILTGYCSFLVNEDKLQNESSFKVSSKAWDMQFLSKFVNYQNFLILFHLGRNFKMS